MEKRRLIRTNKIFGKYNDEIVKTMEIPLNIRVLRFEIGKYK